MKERYNYSKVYGQMRADAIIPLPKIDSRTDAEVLLSKEDMFFLLGCALVGALLIDAGARL